MAGGTKPAPRTRKVERFQDGAEKSSGIRTTKHAGPKRISATPLREDREERIQSSNARERERAKRAGSTNIDQQATGQTSTKYDPTGQSSFCVKHDPAQTDLQ
jgi:hypothetical protein